MKTKLKKMHFTSVDMVRRGANQEATINLYKSADVPSEPPEAPGTDEIPQGLWKSIVEVVKGFLGAGEGNIDHSGDVTDMVPEEVEKAAETFGEKAKKKEYTENRWRYNDALHQSVDSIIEDDNLTEDEKVKMMAESVDQYASAYKKLCEKMIRSSLTNTTMEPSEVGKSQGINPEKEEEREMKIDKSRFNAEELEQYNALIAKGLVEDDDPEEEFEEDEEEMEKKKTCKKSAELHPEVKKALAEMEELKKSMEMKELTEIAKKYVPLGKKEDELAATLYDMKKSSQGSYDAYIAVLDQNLELVNKSGMFAEIGKSGRGIVGGNTTEKIEGIATELQKSDATLGRAQAIMKAWEQHPELVAEYDKEYQGGR